MNPLVELLLGFGAIVLMVIAVAGLIWTIVELGMFLLKIVV